MRLIIAGENPQNSYISEYFEKRGVETLLCEDADRLCRLNGQVGDFTAYIDAEPTQADFVLLTQTVQNAPDAIDGGTPHSLYLEDKVKVLPKKERTAPVAFLLDYFCESSTAASVRAIADATALANKKRRVYYFNKFVRTAPRYAEEMYKEARNAGVIFVKYEDIKVSYDYAQDTFGIKANDGVLTTEIDTPCLFADGSRTPSEKFTQLAKRLRLQLDAQGYINEDRHFLAPVSTCRRGVYALRRDDAAQNLDGVLNTVFAGMQTFACKDSTTPTADIDGEKCVLCYSCLRACPHAALEPNKQARKMDCLKQACEGCGICASVCPGNAITKSDAMFPPRFADKKQCTLVLCCENSAALAADRALAALGPQAKYVEWLPVSCGGCLGFELVSDALRDYAKVMIAVCMEDACKHINGNKRACLQSQRLKEMLTSAGIDPNRVGYTQASHAMPLVLRDELSAFLRGDDA